VFDDDRDYPAVLTWTGIWYLLPLLGYAIWSLTSSGTARSNAVHSLGRDSVDVLVALVLSW